MKLNVDAHLWCLGSYAERYVPGGYYLDMDLDEKLQIFSRLKRLDGLVIFYPTEPLPKNPVSLKKKLSNFNLRISILEPESWSDPKWKYGAFSTGDKRIRRETVEFHKEAVDYAREIEADSVLLWPAHDGFDYPFQADYRDGWKYLIESIQEIGEHDRSVRIAVEYKSKDPRQKQYVSNIGKEMMLLKEVGLDNVGGVIDVGHALMAQESLAESLVILDSHQKLFQIHLNDNYKDSDPDMIFGSINFWEILEFFYYLNKTDYEGWSTIDIIAARDDRAKSLELAVDLTWKYKELADRLCTHSDEIDANLKGNRFSDNMNLLMDILFR